MAEFEPLAPEDPLFTDDWEPWQPQGFLAELQATAKAEGLSDEQVAEAIGHATRVALEQTKAELARTLAARRKKMLRYHGRRRSKFQGHIRHHWGEALDLHFTAYVVALELGANFNHSYRAQAVEEPNYRFHALTQIHARACTVASEIYALTTTGHARGAMARWRTLHELSVTAAILSDSPIETSERYLAHRVVDEYEDAKRYQIHAGRLGYDPYSAEEMEAFEKDRDAAVSKYGGRFHNGGVGPTA